MKRKWIVPGIVLLLMVAAALFPELFAKAEYFLGYAVCSQTPDQSFFAGLHQLPMSARCLGFFAGAFMVELGLIVSDDRNALWPSLPVSLALLFFVGLWVLDGINTSLADMQAFHLYPSSNSAHLVSALLGGTGAAFLMAPFFNSLVWSEAKEGVVFDGLFGVAVFLALDAIFALASLGGGTAVLWALATFSSLGLLATFTLVATMALVVLLRKNRTFARWSDLLWLLLASLGITVLFVVGMYFLKRVGMRSLPPRW